MKTSNKLEDNTYKKYFISIILDELKNTSFKQYEEQNNLIFDLNYLKIIISDCDILITNFKDIDFYLYFDDNKNCVNIIKEKIKEYKF